MKIEVPMLIIDKPYVSRLLAETAVKNGYYVLKNTVSMTLAEKYNFKLIDTETAKSEIQSGKITRIYSNSENALTWINRNIPDHTVSAASELFKDKTRFRREIAAFYPDFQYREVASSDLRALDISAIRKPFILKPSVGFFSIGVYRVDKENQWTGIIDEIENEISSVAGQYPDAVVKVDNFIIEDFIEGEELAVDAYFDSNGEPVILDILHHIYSSGDDVKDRVYKTSLNIIKKYSPLCSVFLKDIGKLFNLKNFPLHIELRVDEKNRIIPIEANPLRFAGWCATDIASYAYNINIYEYYMNNLRPDWNKIAVGREDKIYSIVIGDMPDTIKKEDVKKFRYDEFFGSFSRVLHRRVIDDMDYSVFAFAFVESTPDTVYEVDEMLSADLSSFLEL
ncbi:MAG TPA: ATP-grasp domain-containing protein [Spirochaetota bacterium]|nr:ATP-grasp domain-containing protein [Spirochaetota bacterium]HPJ33556.1 ATP-grasp domain-containing protein [Spirochaetota bacterium]